MQPHQQRVVDEKTELDTKIFALSAFISGSAIYAGLPINEKDRLNRQHGFMKLYSDVLGERIQAFTP